MAGNATFLRLPKLIDALEGAAASGKPRIRLDLLGVTHLDHACRNQVEEFVAQQRGAGLRVELLMPDLTDTGTRVPAAAEPVSVPVPVPDVEMDSAEVWDYATVGTAAVGGMGQMPSGGGPGPTAEWFYLDTRPMPGVPESSPPLLRRGRDWAE